jgi:oligopeptide transport system ATP-binding protein
MLSTLMKIDPPPVQQNGAPILEVRDLAVRFHSHNATVEAVSDVSFDLRAGEVVGIVGESGSGKSQILLSIMGLLPENGAASGSVRFNGEEILNLERRRLDLVRGSAISMIFQDPMTCLTPHKRISRQMTEVLTRHRGMSERDALAAAIRMLDHVQIPEARRRVQFYPHEFSGGMRQRVMIAMALLCEPAILFADEPTTALDVTVQAQILDLIADLARDLGTAVALVTHDFGVVSRLCDQVIVLYGGKVMESGLTTELFEASMHPYTKGLLASMPQLETPRGGELPTIPGQPRGAGNWSGCPFAPRCQVKSERCTLERPALRSQSTHAVACHQAEVPGYER